MKKTQPVKKEKLYDYSISKMEAKYRIKSNPDKEKFTELLKQVKDNNNFCPLKEKTKENRCMCEQFLNRDSEGFCKFKLYLKEERSEKEIEKYVNATFSWNEKKEKEINKEFDKELKAQKQPMLEDEESE